MAASLGNAIGAVGGFKKAKEGGKMARRAQKAIDEFEYSDLMNPYDEVGVSRLGTDLQRDQLSRNMATSVDALRSGGIRGVLGGIGQINSVNNQANRQIAADLDQQRLGIDMARAQDQSVIRGMQENREFNELQGYGQMLNVGMQMKYGGYADLANAGRAQGETNIELFNTFKGFFGGGGGGMMGG